MIEVQLSDSASVRVDVCRICHFVWFDAHETKTLVPRPVVPAPPTVPQKAREAAAMLKVQQLAEKAREPELQYSGALWGAIADFLKI